MRRLAFAAAIFLPGLAVAQEADDPGLPAKLPVTVPEGSDRDTERSLSPPQRPLPNSAFDGQGRIAPFADQSARQLENNLTTIQRRQQPGYSVGRGNIISRQSP